MHIVHYCQYVLGMGHLFRSLEIARALGESGTKVTFVTGGPPVTVAMPEGVTLHQLPPLMMDADFSQFVCMGGASDDEKESPETKLQRIKDQRAKELHALMHRIRPDAFIVELFPFGRNAFSFELLPVLEEIRQGTLAASNGPMKVFCSLRDILVEKTDQTKFEQRVLSRLNPYFDGLLVHTDPSVVTLGETFSRMEQITLPVINTGYVTPRLLPSAADAGQNTRHQLHKSLGISTDIPLVIASAGSGSVGEDLLRNTVKASVELIRTTPHQLLVYTGPYMDQLACNLMKRDAEHSQHILIEKFTDTFTEHLAAADLSISMGGYNTTMNLLSAKTFGLVAPFDSNREQRMRSEKLERLGLLRILKTTEQTPAQLAAVLRQLLTTSQKARRHQIDLNGAQETAKHVIHLSQQK